MHECIAGGFMHSLGSGGCPLASEKNLGVLCHSFPGVGEAGTRERFLASESETKR